MTSTIRDILIDEIPVVNQFEATDESWKERACGVASLKMLLVHKNRELDRVTVDELISKGIECDAYIANLGWKHDGLVCLADKYGVSLVFQRQFYSGDDKLKGLDVINAELSSRRPVAVSVYSGFNGQKNSHLVIVSGARFNGESLSGYFIQDPYSGSRGHKYFVTKEEFLIGWRGGMLRFS